ncbi:MAG: ribosome maturation factor RimP [Nocardioidaceae bacterium]
MSTAPTHDRLVKALGPVVAALQLELEDVEVTPAGRRRKVRVIVDKDGGISLDEISDATRAVSQHLDDSDLLDEQPYTLEVTSPGTDRPLTEPRHWRRNVSRLVKVTDHDGETVTGRILDAAETSAHLDVAGSTRVVAFDDVAKASIQVEFNRKED